MYLIIIHSNNFDHFLSINRIYYKDTKVRYVVSSHVIVSLNFKNDKRNIKQLKTYVQVNNDYAWYK